MSDRGAKPDPTPPPWPPRRDAQQQMVDWTNARLDEEDEAQKRRREDALLLHLGVPPEKLKREGDRQAMIDQVCARIDEDDETRTEALLFLHGVPPEHREKYFKWVREDGYELEAARHGVIEPLRQRYPHLAEAGVLKLPDLKRGEKYNPEFIGIRTLGQLRHKGDVEAAAKEVKRILQLWATHYGRRNPRPSVKLAVEIAAQRHGVSEEEVARLRKNLSRAKSPIS